MVIALNEVGAFPSLTPGGFQIRFGVYLPGVRAADGFEVVVRVIHRDDRFDPAIAPRDTPLAWDSTHPLDLWSETVAVLPAPGTSFGKEGMYLYRFQLSWSPPGGPRTIVTEWFCDPFARETDVGELSAVRVARAPPPVTWTDANHKTPELDELIVYELQVEEFNDTFEGVIERIPYLLSLGVNCLELMPVTSPKMDFDWGYGPLNYFAPAARFGDPAGLGARRRLPCARRRRHPRRRVPARGSVLPLQPGLRRHQRHPGRAEDCQPDDRRGGELRPADRLFTIVRARLRRRGQWLLARRYDSTGSATTR